MNWKTASGVILVVMGGLCLAALTRAGSMPSEVAVIKSVQGEHERRIGALEEAQKQYARDISDIANYVRRRNP